MSFDQWIHPRHNSPDQPQSTGVSPAGSLLLQPVPSSPGNHRPDLHQHRLVLAALDLHINAIIQVSFFIGPAAFARLNGVNINCAMCISSSFLCIPR